MEITILGNKLRVEIIVLCMLVGAFIACNVWCTCSGGVREGFNSASRISGAALGYNMGDDIKGSWTNPDQSKGGNYASFFKGLEANKVGAVPPLPNGRLDMFYMNESRPECCPSTYSSSTGCLCETPEQAMYLNSRGGNRTFSTNY